MLYSPNKKERHDLTGKLLNMAWASITLILKLLLY
jgi:hypothetical protein